MAHREFRDAQGTRWEVWDVFPTTSISGGVSSLSEDAAEGWLAFQCAREKRRFHRPPPGWDTLTDAQLAFLCAHAVPASAPPRPERR
jgi:hypothetical protein